MLVIAHGFPTETGQPRDPHEALDLEMGTVPGSHSSSQLGFMQFPESKQTKDTSSAKRHWHSAAVCEGEAPEVPAEWLRGQRGGHQVQVVVQALLRGVPHRPARRPLGKKAGRRQKAEGRREGVACQGRRVGVFAAKNPKQTIP